MVSALEIILIIVVIIIIALTARIVRMGRVATGQNAATNKGTITTPGGQSKTASLMNRGGISLVITGIIVLVVAVSLFRWLLQSYLWAIILIALGVLLVVLSRKKR